MNTVSLLGRLTKDLEIKFDKNGKKYSKFTLAVRRTNKNNDGIYPADFIPCVIFGDYVEILKKYTSKGCLIGVEGNLVSAMLKNEESTKFYLSLHITNVTFVESNKKSSEINLNSNSQLNDDINKTTIEMTNDINSPYVISDDELPF